MHAARTLRSVAAASLVLGTIGCGTLTPGATPVGTPIETVRHGIVAPTGEYKLPNGGIRLEFAQGSFGKQTWMLDFDAGGHLVANQQVLTEANFGNITPGMQANDVRMEEGYQQLVVDRGAVGVNTLFWNFHNNRHNSQ